MSYEETVKLLQDNHIYPLSIEKNLRTGNIMSIEVTCSPLLKDEKIQYLKNLLGDKFDYRWFGNDNDYILITKLK